MLRSFLLCVLGLMLSGCGSGDEDGAELRTYVQKMGQFEAMNKEVAGFITRLDQPSFEITEADLEQARELVKRYVAQVQRTKSADFTYRELRVTHDNYLRKIEQANELVVNTGHELKRERGNVAIGMRYVEKMTKLHYTNLDVLWLRTNQQGELPLAWPE